MITVTKKKGVGGLPFGFNQSLWPGKQSYLRIFNFEAFGLLTLIFPFDSATVVRMHTLTMSVGPYERVVKEVSHDKW